MLKFRKLNDGIDQVPSVGFSFRDPDTGKEFKGSNYKSFEDLEYHVQHYRTQNNLPQIENFRECWEHYICSNYPTNKNMCCPVEAAISRKFIQYISGGVAYLKLALQKEENKFVEKEEAQRRADLCLKCQLNRKNYGHSFAHYYTDKMMAKSVGNRRVDNWQNLFTCMGCSCILNSKVWFNGKIVGGSLLRDDIEKMKGAKDYSGSPLKCWQLEERDKLNEKEK